jgi:multidrug efflux pump subunit AcrA (membrane-fusion protein)
MSFRTVLAAGALCLAVWPGCNRGAQAPAGPPSFPPAAVKLEVAKPAPIEDTSEYIAVLKSLRSTAVQPQIDGQVTEIFVKSGDRVGQGQRAGERRVEHPAAAAVRTPWTTERTPRPS